jgi:hypothetical protein
LYVFNGIGLHSLQLVAKVDVRRFPTEKHFASWLGVCPRQHESNHTKKKRSPRKGKNRVAIALRMAAQALGRTQSPLGLFYRRIKSRLGGKGAVTATAHKLACLVYRMLKYGREYAWRSLAEYEQTVFTDGVSGGGQVNALRDAVLAANQDSGADTDTIQLAAGTYTLTIRNTGGHHETAGLEGDLNITNTSHRLIIQGAGSSGPNATIIDASQLQDRVFDIVNPGTQVAFQDLVIQGGLAQDDGSNGALAGSTDALGGGILNNGGNVTLDHVVLQNNVARGGDAASLSAPGHNARGGGFYSTGGALTMAGATITSNQAIGGRGGDHNGTNRAGDGGSAGGGGLYASGGSLDISESKITSNKATCGRGGDGYSTYTFSGIGYTGGVGQGGGLYASGGSVTIASSTMATNQGTGASGGLGGGDGAGQGGGLYTGGTLTLTDSTLSGNSAPAGGGGIFNTGTLTVSTSTLSGNSAAAGGGIWNTGTLMVSNSTLSGNSTTRSFVGGGGGIANNGALTVINSTLSGNSTSDSGGGLNVYGGSPVLHNTLIAGNFRGTTGTTRDDVAGALDSGGDHNLIGDGTGMTGLSNGINGNLVGSAAAPIDPLFGPLQDNGGPTKTHALLPGSPAIDAGNNAYATDFDQRGPGFPRIVNGTIDIGAFEVQAATKVTHYSINAPASAVAGSAFNVTVKALSDSGNPVGGYIGTVHFRSSDGQAILPSDYTFTSDDAGVHTFTVTLKTAGTQSITATDTIGGFSASATGILVSPAAASTLTFSGVPSTVTAGSAFGFTLTARDPFNNIATGYGGTVTFTSTDSQATLPANFTFTAADGGVHIFAE